jgi:hypothetical protein
MGEDVQELPPYTHRPPDRINPGPDSGYFTSRFPKNNPGDEKLAGEHIAKHTCFNPVLTFHLECAPGKIARQASAPLPVHLSYLSCITMGGLV